MANGIYHIYEADPNFNARHGIMMTLYNIENIDQAMIVFTGNDFKNVSKVHREDDDSAWFNMMGLGFYIEHDDKDEDLDLENMDEDEEDFAPNLNLVPPQIGEYTDFGRVVRNIEVGQKIRNKFGTELVKTELEYMKLVLRGTTSTNSFATINTEYFEQEWAIVSEPVTFSQAVEQINDSSVEVYFLYKGNVYTTFTKLEELSTNHLATAQWFVEINEAPFHEGESTVLVIDDEDEEDDNILYIDDEDEF